jgi:activator of 2-hydroxyglutaryl-CoA dehydratase
MAGGVAKNIGVVKALKVVMGTDIQIPPEPQIVSALGAALLAMEKLK